MKRLIFISMLFFFGLAAMANGPVDKLSKEEVTHMTKTEHKQRVKILENRVKEIRNIPVTSLSPNEKKDIKSELNYIRKEIKMHQEAYVFYISGGLLLLLIILLIVF